MRLKEDLKLPSTMCIETLLSDKADVESVLNNCQDLFFLYGRLLDTRLYVYDILDTKQEDVLCDFSIKAKICVSVGKPPLQHLKLLSNKENTFSLDLDFAYYGGDQPNFVSLCGRHTSTNRAFARKQLITGLASATYSGSIEQARQRLLLTYAKVIATELMYFDVQLAETNTAMIYKWLVKLLG